ncbi:MAG: hypothetical protein KAS23_00150 [Anaerohalosphaera sp.]|nr:hypothetical protein [Anaerohalosphaera sp.]
MLKKISIITLLTACIVITTGCQDIEQQNDEVFSRYYLTSLKWSKSADVLPELTRDCEIITQNESVVASWNQKDDSSQIWFNIVTFDEEKLTANRKYAFMVDEKAKGFAIAPTQKLRFDAELVLPADILNEAYTSENEKRISVMKYIRTIFAEDIGQLSPDSKELEAAGMLVINSLNQCIYPLEQTPGLAKQLPKESGMEFDHMNFDAGRVRMLINDDTAKIKIKIGSVVEDFDTQLDVQAM